MQLRIEGKDAALASENEIASGLSAASRIFSERGRDPALCSAAMEKLERGELLEREEAMLCLVWDEARDAALHAVTLGWLSRSVDIRLVLR